MQIFFPFECSTMKHFGKKAKCPNSQTDRQTDPDRRRHRLSKEEGQDECDFCKHALMASVREGGRKVG